MVRNSDKIQFPVFYLIIPIMAGAAFAVPAGDAFLGVFAIEPTGVAKFLARVISGLLIGAIPLLLLIGVRRKL